MPSSQPHQVGIRWLLSIAAAVVLIACSPSAEPLIIRDPPTFSIDLRTTLVATDTGLANDPIAIDSARVDGDTLAVSVSHGGGCSDHTYRLVVGTEWMESSPVQVGARISHDAHGDNCRALLRYNLRISLSPLADAYRASYQQNLGSVMIRLAGSSASLLYKF